MANRNIREMNTPELLELDLENLGARQLGEVILRTTELIERRTRPNWGPFLRRGNSEKLCALIEACLFRLSEDFVDYLTIASADVRVSEIKSS